MKHQARKRFGQHFLVDQGVLASIVRAIAARPDDHVVEIGPGLGALTQHLLDALPRIDAVEIDRDLVAALQRRWPATRLRLHAADALQFDYSTLIGSVGARLRLVGNLPYNISSPLLFALLAWRDRIQDQHFMLQKEVIDRIVAVPGTAAYGRLSVMLQAAHHVECLFEVPPEAFDPPPRVDSAVVRMIPREQALCGNLETLERLMERAFAQRRKMLRGTLWPWLAQQGLDPEDPAWAIPPTARPEEITVESWCRLADGLRISRTNAG
ncbi:MAG: 16S rRNA (adenine(1518)-N(6)/adenine(1519)-N(6))-dimethyltransferase RsmA [Burkholderiales bacterium]